VLLASRSVPLGYAQPDRGVLTDAAGTRFPIGFPRHAVCILITGSIAEFIPNLTGGLHRDQGIPKSFAFALRHEVKDVGIQSHPA
jgi:hypothetical protein